ncbi:MAG TPA: DUF3459 domain-containing protein, partial [Vicinamibacterales bacterium]|nr:DUF3459 domain-containing protein [Vicinamibacterales bacterium]
FHHVVRRLVAGDAHGYYEDYMGTTEELARTIAQGWLFTGEHSRHLGMMRGTDPSSIPMYRFIVCVQNHDQVGNRAFGDRLHQRVDAATWRAISALLLMVPMTPLLFMGQEWAASAPFQYFTDLEPELGKLVTAGRRGEFRHFPEFARPDASERIPDPQSPATFERSRLGWDERDEPDHARVLALYRALLDLRRREPALGASHALAGEAFPPDEDSLVMKRTAGDAEYLVFARLRGSGRIDAGAGLSTGAGGWEVRLTTEEPRFSADPRPPRIETAGGRPVVCFDRPGAAILRARP